MAQRRRNMAKIVVLFCIAALPALADIAQAEDGGWGGKQCGKHERHNFEKFGKKLGLTDAQKAQAQTVLQETKDVMKPLFTNLRAEQKNLQALMHADTIDEVAIRAESAKIAGIQADLNVNRAKAKAQFRAILTPAQLTTLKTLHQKRHKKNDATTDPLE